MEETQNKKTSVARRKAYNKYRKTKCKQIALVFYPTDMYIYDALKPINNRNKFIKDSIKQTLNLQ